MNAPQGKLSFFSELAAAHRLYEVIKSLPTEAGAVQYSPALRVWFQELLPRLQESPEYVQSLERARNFVPVPGVPAFSEDLIEYGPYRLSLMGIHRLRPVPLHDHPNSWSAQWILNGRLLIRQYDPAPVRDGAPSLTYLEQAAQQLLKPGDISTVTPTSRNIHSLSPQSGNAILLSIQHPPCPPHDQSWYFPANPLSKQGPSLLCNRVGHTSAKAKLRPQAA